MRARWWARCSPEHAGRRRDPRRGRSRGRRRRDARPAPRGRDRGGNRKRRAAAGDAIHRLRHRALVLRAGSLSRRACSTDPRGRQDPELRGAAARRPVPAPAWHDAGARGRLGDRRGRARARSPARRRPRQRDPAPVPARARVDPGSGASGPRARGSRIQPGCSTRLRATGLNAGNRSPPPAISSRRCGCA